MIVDLFAGPGGWDQGARLAGLDDVVGLEWEHTACLTASTAGHHRLRADVAAYPADRFAGADGLIASPPCTDWSQAGNRLKRDGASGDLVDQVPRWVAAVRPRWFACEQVPPALVAWQEFAHTLRALGYSTWAGILNAADFGVPQTRRRAFLLGKLDGPAHPPAPTHAKLAGDDLFDTRLPWVSMAEALGWVDPVVNTGRDWKPGGSRDDAQTIPGDQPAPTVDGKGRWHVYTGAGTRQTRPGGPSGETYTEYSRSIEEPAPTIMPNADRWRVEDVVLHSSSATRPNDRTRPRPATSPAPTIAFGHARMYWEDRWSNGPANDPEWPATRPATTVAGDPRIAQPGHKAERTTPDAPGRMAGAIRVEDWEAGVLQSFPADYPWQGNQSQRFTQIGNAVPPVLAAAILAELAR